MYMYIPATRVNLLNQHNVYIRYGIIMQKL